MLGVADRQQSFVDAAWGSDLPPEDSIYVLLAACMGVAEGLAAASPRSCRCEAGVDRAPADALSHVPSRRVRRRVPRSRLSTEEQHVRARIAALARK